MTYSFYDTPYSWYAYPVRYDDVANQSLQLLNHARMQSGAPLLELIRNPNGQPSAVSIERNVLEPGVNGTSNCPPLLGAYIIISTLRMQNKELWQLAAHEMLHLAGAEHGGFYDSFYPGAENEDTPTRTSTCGSTADYPNYPQHPTDDVAHLNYLHGNPGNRQLMADSGFENGYEAVWWIIGTGVWSTATHSNSYEGSRRAYFAPPAASDVQSMQGRVRLQTGNGNESYRLRLAAGPPSSTTPTTLRVKLITRSQTYGVGSNNCPYPDGLDQVDPNLLPSPGFWTVVQDITWYLGTTGWFTLTSAWYNPPTSHARDFSIWVQGYADAPGSTHGNIILDNMTVEATQCDCS